jgi:hypothetical protein
MGKLDIAYVFRAKARGYLMFSRGTPPEVVTQWARALAALQKTRFFVQVARKWREQGLDLKYEPELGLHRIDE